MSVPVPHNSMTNLKMYPFRLLLVINYAHRGVGETTLFVQVCVLALQAGGKS